jgi:phage protein D
VIDTAMDALRGAGQSAISSVLDAGTAAISGVVGLLRTTGAALLQGGNYPNALYRLTVDDVDIAQLIAPRLISLNLTDNRGIEADTLDVVLSDHDGLLNIPPKGATLQLWLGWSDTGLIDKGTFVVDETEHAGAPDVLTLRARSADLRGQLKVKRENTWTDTTVDAVIFAIAVRNGLEPVTSPIYHNVPVAQLLQANESDANVLTRLGEQYDAVATVKAGKLLFMPASGGKTASGGELPHILLTRQDGDNHRYLQANRDSYDGVRAYYYDVNSAAKQHAIAGAGGDNLKDLRHSYSDRDSALRAAMAEWNRLQRGSATLSYNLALGRPELIPELTYTLSGVKDEIDAIIWHGGNVQHSLTADAGYTTSLELESQLPEDTFTDLYEEGPQHYTGVIAYYRDKTGQQKTLTAGDPTQPKRLTPLYSTKASAKRALDREWLKIQEADNPPA